MKESMTLAGLDVVHLTNIPIQMEGTLKSALRFHFDALRCPGY
jgi:hypothetical protein